jgi:hypothetical protein
MSLFDWFKPKKPAPTPISSGLPSDGLTAPVLPSHPVHPAHATQTTLTDATLGGRSEVRAQRQTRREQMYAVVRSTMLRHEVLAARYKFKVLSLDNHGRQFLIMVDLSPEQPLTVAQQTQVEEHMRTSALRAHQLLVKSVYWRVVPASSAGAAIATPPIQQQNKAAAPNSATPSASVSEAIQTSVSRQPRITRPVYDPIDPAEVLAFKQAVAAAQAKPAATATPAAPDSAFPDTLVLDPEDNTAALSRTQYGDLD